MSRIKGVTVSFLASILLGLFTFSSLVFAGDHNVNQKFEIQPLNSINEASVSCQDWVVEGREQGKELDVLVFVDRSYSADQIDNDINSQETFRQETLHFIADILFADAQLRKVANQMSIWTYADNPLNTMPWEYVDEVGIGDIHQTIRDMPLSAGRTTTNIEELFETITQEVSKRRNRNTVPVIFILTDMNPEATNPAEDMGSVAYGEWQVVTGDAKIYMLDFSQIAPPELSESYSNEALVLEAVNENRDDWNTRFFGNTLVDGELYSLNTNNKLLVFKTIMENLNVGAYEFHWFPAEDGENVNLTPFGDEAVFAFILNNPSVYSTFQSPQSVDNPNVEANEVYRGPYSHIYRRVDFNRFSWHLNGPNRGLGAMYAVVVYGGLKRLDLPERNVLATETVQVQLTIENQTNEQPSLTWQDVSASGTSANHADALEPKIAGNSYTYTWQFVAPQNETQLTLTLKRGSSDLIKCQLQVNALPELSIDAYTQLIPGQSITVTILVTHTQQSVVPTVWLEQGGVAREMFVEPDTLVTNKFYAVLDDTGMLTMTKPLTIATQINIDMGDNSTVVLRDAVLITPSTVQIVEAPAPTPELNLRVFFTPTYTETQAIFTGTLLASTIVVSADTQLHLDSSAPLGYEINISQIGLSPTVFVPTNLIVGLIIGTVLLWVFGMGFSFYFFRSLFQE